MMNANKTLQEKIYDTTETVDTLLDWLAPQQNTRGEFIIDHLTRRHSSRSPVSLIDATIRKIQNNEYYGSHNVNPHENYNYYDVDKNYGRQEAFTESTFTSDPDLFFALKESIASQAENIAEWLTYAEQGEETVFRVNIGANDYEDEGVYLGGSGIVYDKKSTLYPVTTNMKTLVITCDRSNPLGFGVVTFYPDCNLSPTSQLDTSIDMATEMRKTYAYKNAQSKQEKHRLLGMCPDFQPPRERVNAALIDNDSSSFDKELGS